jgi:hypothetical protein
MSKFNNRRHGEIFSIAVLLDDGLREVIMNITPIAQGFFTYKALIAAVV